MMDVCTLMNQHGTSSRAEPHPAIGSAAMKGPARPRPDLDGRSSVPPPCGRPRPLAGVGRHARDVCGVQFSPGRGPGQRKEAEGGDSKSGRGGVKSKTGGASRETDARSGVQCFGSGVQLPPGDSAFKILRTTQAGARCVRMRLATTRCQRRCPRAARRRPTPPGTARPTDRAGPGGCPRRRSRPRRHGRRDRRRRDPRGRPRRRAPPPCSSRRAQPDRRVRRWRPKIFMGEMLVCFGWSATCRRTRRHHHRRAAAVLATAMIAPRSFCCPDDLAGHARVPPPAWGLAVAPKSAPTPVPLAAAGVRRRP